MDSKNIMDDKLDELLRDYYEKEKASIALPPVPDTKNGRSARVSILTKMREHARSLSPEKKRATGSSLLKAASMILILGLTMVSFTEEKGNTILAELIIQKEEQYKLSEEISAGIQYLKKAFNSRRAEKAGAFEKLTLLKPADSPERACEQEEAL